MRSDQETSYKRGGKKVLARNSTPRMSPRVWALKQNKESMALNVVWASPLPILLISLFVQSGVLAVLGFFLMPVAAIAALIDASNIGSVTYCFEPSPGSPARMAP